MSELLEVFETGDRFLTMDGGKPIVWTVGRNGTLLRNPLQADRMAVVVAMTDAVLACGWQPEGADSGAEQVTVTARPPAPGWRSDHAL